MLRKIIRRQVSAVGNLWESNKPEKSDTPVNVAANPALFPVTAPISADRAAKSWHYRIFQVSSALFAGWPYDAATLKLSDL
ncbi:hypothetical protein [Pantoea sp. Ep11b]|uniref:hypothetical protein n=1 Tax=Pantoea sp. Ep11b TaxID=3141459 RepID=UPI00345FDF94